MDTGDLESKGMAIQEALHGRTIREKEVAPMDHETEIPVLEKIKNHTNQEEKEAHINQGKEEALGREGLGKVNILFLICIFLLIF